jgi:hypothetical protein
MAPRFHHPPGKSGTAHMTFFNWNFSLANRSDTAFDHLPMSNFNFSVAHMLVIVRWKNEALVSVPAGEGVLVPLFAQL